MESISNISYLASAQIFGWPFDDDSHDNTAAEKDLTLGSRVSSGRL